MRRFLYLLTSSTFLLGSSVAALADSYTLAQGQYTLVGSVQGYGSGPSANFQQGWSIGWNAQTGLGETDFVNNKGTGAGGFSFFNTSPALWNAATKPASIMTLSGVGTLKPVALDLNVLVGAGGTTTLGQLLTLAIAAAPLNSPVLTGTPKLATAPAAGDTSLDLVSAGWVSNLVTQAVANANSSAAITSSTDLSPAKITPSGSSTAQTAAAIGALAVAALPATDAGLASAESEAGSALQPAAIGATVAAYNDSRIVSALQPSNVGSNGTNGVAAYNDSRITGALPANNAALATAESLAGSALQPGNVGSSGTNGVAAYNDSRIVGAAPLASPTFTGTPKLTTAPAANDTSLDIVSAGWVQNLVTTSGGHATSVSSGTDISQANITPTGASSSQTAAAIGALAVGAVQSSAIGAASGVASLNSSSQIPSAQIPFGTVTNTVADGGVLNTVKTTANGATQKANNLSDVANPTTALSNLGGLSLANGGTVSGSVIYSGAVTHTGNTVIGSGVVGAVIKMTGALTFTPSMCNNTYISQDTSGVVYTIPQGLPLNCRTGVIQGNSGQVTLAGVTGSNAETLDLGPNQTAVTGGQWTGVHFRIMDATNALVNDTD